MSQLATVDYERLADLPDDAEAEASLELLGVSLEQVVAELNYRRQQKVAKMTVEMAAAAKAGRERRTLRGEGGGEVEMMIHPTSYHYWGQRLGYACWDDKQFRREYRRDNDAARVVSRSDRLTIVKPDLACAGTAPAGAIAKHSAPNRATLSPVRRGVHGKRGRWGL